MKAAGMLSLIFASVMSAGAGLTALADTGPCQLANPMSLFPVPMNYDAQPHGSNFFKTQASSKSQIESYNADGTLTTNPVVDAGSIRVHGVNYLRKKLSSSDSIQFQGKSYPVYSVIPEKMTIGYASRNITEYYDPAELSTNLVDIPDSPTLNSKPQSLVSLQLTKTKTQVPGDDSQVYLVDNNYYLPELGNSSGQHDGLSENVYWTIDPWMNNPNAKPIGNIIHLLPYGWALDASTADQSLYFQRLVDGGNSGGNDLIRQAVPPYNYWKTALNLEQNELDTIRNLIQGNPQYPFPNPAWLQFGIYMPIQPMPGFQRNLIRCYTPWGAWNSLNNTSGLFVLQDGSIEIPLDASGKPYPWVTQTWDSNQRYTLLNQTDDVVPSTQDQYPGNESYFASNAYLPNSAGVITSYKDYTIYDDVTNRGFTPANASSFVHYLNPRQTDLWLGLKGDTINEVMVWDKANDTEPGGQANKPYMLGADTSYNVHDGYLYHTIRLEHANSFMIARLTQAQDAGKLYSAALYVDLGDTNGYQKVATLSYQWQPWTIDIGGKWAKSPDGKGAWVPTISEVTTNTDLSKFITVAQGDGWDLQNRVMPWRGLGIYNNDGSQVNKLSSPVYFYILGASLTNAGNLSPQNDAAKSKFLVVLAPISSPPVNEANYTIKPPTNTVITVVQGAKTISEPPYAFTVTTQAPNIEEVDVKGTLAGNNITCRLGVNTTQWRLQAPTDCSQYFVATSGKPGDITMILPTPPPPPANAGYYELIPYFHGDLQKPDTLQVAIGDGVTIVQPQKPVPPGAVLLAVTAGADKPADVQITVTNVADSSKTAGCVLTMSSTKWSISNNQSANADCGKFQPAGNAGPTLDSASTIGIGTPDKAVGPTPPTPPAGAGYYLLSPGAGDSLDISGVVNALNVTNNMPITITTGTIKDNTAQIMTINITGPTGNKATCVMRIGTDTWQQVGECGFLPPPVLAAPSADKATSAIIGVGVP